MPTETKPKTTRRALLGTAALGLSGYTGYAKMQDAEPDGQIITFPDCRTAIVEGANWSQIRFSKIYGPTQNGMGQTQPDDDGITRLSVEDGEEGYINWVRCYVERDGTRFLAVERNHPNADECKSNLPTTTTPTTTEDELETTTQDTEFVDINPTITFNGCESVTITAERYTSITLGYDKDGTERFTGEWEGEHTFGGDIDKQINWVKVSNGSDFKTKTNPNSGCETDITDDPEEAAETTTTTEQVAEVREVETETTTTAEPAQTTRQEQRETTTRGSFVGRLIRYPFSL